MHEHDEWFNSQLAMTKTEFKLEVMNWHLMFRFFFNEFLIILVTNIYNLDDSDLLDDVPQYVHPELRTFIFRESFKHKHR